MSHYVLILAAGGGSRLNSKIPKQFLELNNLPIAMHSMITFYDADPDAKIYIALPERYMKQWPLLCEKYNFRIQHKVYCGGNNRLSSVFKGMQMINKQNTITKKRTIISIHDAARPFISRQFILDLIQTAYDTGIAIPGLPLKNSLRYKKQALGNNTTSVNRNQYIAIQTPQVFHFKDIFNAYKKIDTLNNKQLFDDASVYDNLYPSKGINLIPGREKNIKITTELDYLIAQKMYRLFK